MPLQMATTKQHLFIFVKEIPCMLNASTTQDMSLLPIVDCLSVNTCDSPVAITSGFLLHAQYME